jgi:hypothetical protein
VKYHLKTEVDCHYKKHSSACNFAIDLGDLLFWGPNFLEAGKIKLKFVSFNILLVLCQYNIYQIIGLNVEKHLPHIICTVQNKSWRLNVWQHVL